MNEGAQRLRELLRRGHLTQIDVANEADVSQPAVSRWLNKGAKPELAARRAIERLGRKHRMSIPIDSWDRPARAESNAA